MGTYGVDAIRTLEAAHAQAGQTLVAAPVLGRPDMAASGQLGVVPGGPEDAVARCAPLLNLIGRRIFPAGPRPECATAIKLANNAVLGCAMVAMAEGFALVRKYGVLPQVFQDVMVEGLFAATAYKVYGQKMVDESYDQVGSPITVGLKDALLIAAAADLARVPMPSHDVYHQRLLGAVAHGDADRDQAVLAREQARAVGYRFVEYAVVGQGPAAAKIHRGGPGGNKAWPCAKERPDDCRGGKLLKSGAAAGGAAFTRAGAAPAFLRRRLPS